MIGRVDNVTLDPAPAEWPDLLRRGADSDRHREVRERLIDPIEARRSLGLPTDRPIVMTGHQAGIWHAGILAKYIAADGFAAQHDAGVAWLGVDQDVNDPGLVRHPWCEDDGLIAGEWNRESAGWIALGVPTGMRPSRAPAAMPDAAGACGSGLDASGLEAVHARLEQIRAALDRHRGASSEAAQAMLAAGDLMSATVPAASLVWATSIAGSEAFAPVLESIRSVPAACVHEYNSALRDRYQPHSKATLGEVAGVRPLAASEGRQELPLWRVERERPRSGVDASSLASLDASRLAPRALLLTGFARALLCDLFIHGTGGGVYDRIAEIWFQRWLGVRLAPSVVATADVRLELGEGGPDVRSIQRTVARAHRAAHDPSLLGDEAAAREKWSLVEAIDEAKRRGEDPQPRFRRMHDLLAEVRDRKSDALAALREEAAAASAKRDEAAIADDRTWAFPLLGDDAIGALNRRIRDGFERGRV